MKPTLHLTNWSFKRLHGPGRKWTIMAAPRGWERGDGVAPAFVPPHHWLCAVQEGRMTESAYFDGLRGRWSGVYGTPEPFAPGGLLAYVGIWSRAVADGDSLLCCCSREKAAEGRCHRATAAPFLTRAGWRVLLDGVEVTT